MPDLPGIAADGRELVRSFNLLPWRERRQAMRRHRALVALAIGAIGAFGLLAGLELALRNQLGQQEQRIGQLRDAISVQRRTAADREALEERMAHTSALLAEVDRIRRANASALAWLEALPEQVPEGLRLTGLALAGQAWELHGLAANMNQSAALLARVRAMPMVSDVRIEQLQSNPDMSRQFVLAGSLRP